VIFLEIAKAMYIVVGWRCLVCYQGLLWFRLEVHNRRPLTATATAATATADCPRHRFSIRQGKQPRFFVFTQKKFIFFISGQKDLNFVHTSVTALHKYITIEKRIRKNALNRLVLLSNNTV
jgi:hypothetical protein